MFNCSSIIVYDNVRMLNEHNFQKGFMMNPAKPHLGKQLKIYYASQVAVEPPTIVLFVNDPELLHFSYARYIENKLREAFGFTGTPIKILARKRS